MGGLAHRKKRLLERDLKHRVIMKTHQQQYRQHDQYKNVAWHAQEYGFERQDMVVDVDMKRDGVSSRLMHGGEVAGTMKGSSGGGGREWDWEVRKRRGGMSISALLNPVES